MMAMEIRVERDTLGEKEVPADAYYGIETQRAIENFPISGRKAHSYLIKAMVAIKKAACLANRSIGLIDEKISYAILTACDEILAGNFSDQFVVDVFQAGAGTSFNMNVNEVIANRAIEILGGKRGDYRIVHPHDHVNMGQSTNDTFPSAMKIASIMHTNRLADAMKGLEEALSEKAVEFRGIVKAARTHLQDAVPISLSRVFGGYALTVKRHRDLILRARDPLYEMNLGATAAGTSVGAHPEFGKRCVEFLREITSFPLRNAEDLVEVTQSMACFSYLSSILKNFSLELIRICNDLRLMSSGPRAGLAEIRLPAVQPGSSLMPGKINPSIVEMVNMVCYQVVGNDLAVSMAVQAGQLDLNAMMPSIAHNLMDSFEIMRNALYSLTERCIKGITANREICERYAEMSIALATIFSPYIGYDRAAAIAKEAFERGISIRELVKEKGLLSQDQIDDLMDLRKISGENI